MFNRTSRRIYSCICFPNEAKWIFAKHPLYSLSFSGPMFVPGASAPSDKTPLQSFVDKSVSESLVKYFEDKGDPGNFCNLPCEIFMSGLPRCYYRDLFLKLSHPELIVELFCVVPTFWNSELNFPMRWKVQYLLSSIWQWPTSNKRLSLIYNCKRGPSS